MVPRLCAEALVVPRCFAVPRVLLGAGRTPGEADPAEAEPVRLVAPPEPAAVALQNWLLHQVPVVPAPVVPVAPVAPPTQAEERLLRLRRREEQKRRLLIEEQ